MKKKIAILQSNYIPWRGYFDLINEVDEFIFFDECQYTKNDWRNRNHIKANDKSLWLTIPIKKNKLTTQISQVEFSNRNWITKHLKTINQFYQNCDYFFPIYNDFSSILTSSSGNLSNLNMNLIINFSKKMKINTIFLNSKDFMTSKIKKDRSQRLVDICKERDAAYYFTGPSAKNYLDIELFIKENINVIFYDYGTCKKYQQTGKNFISSLSIIDALMNCGYDNAKYFLNSIK